MKPELIYSFASGVSELKQGVALATDNNFYGVSKLGGGFGDGALYRITPAGALSIIADFGANDGDLRGKNPEGQLTVVTSDHTSLYGITRYGGRFGEGTLFESDLNGNVVTLLDFGSDAVPISSPTQGLVLGPDGNLYGVALGGGAFGFGGVFRVSRQGRFQLVASFSDAKGYFPTAPLAVLADGTLVGTLGAGGSARYGTIFKVSPDGVLSVLANFAPSGTTKPGLLVGNSSAGRPAVTSDGSVYGEYLTFDQTTFITRATVWKWTPGTASATQFAFLDKDSGGASLSITQLALLANGTDLIQFVDYASAYSGPGLFTISSAGVVTGLKDLSTFSISTSTTSGTPLISDGAGGYVGPLGNQLFSAPISGSPVVLASATPDAGTGLGAFPNDTPVVLNDGTIIGQTAAGGSLGFGTVYRIPTTGPVTAVTPARTFSYSDQLGEAENPLSLDLTGTKALFVDSSGGANYSGSMSSIGSDGTVTSLAEFGGSPPNDFTASPTGGLAPIGSLYYGHGTKYNFTTGKSEDVVFSLNGSNQLAMVAKVPAFGNPYGGGYSSGPLSGDGMGGVLGLQSFGGTSFEGIIYRISGGSVTKVIDFASPASRTSLHQPIGPILAPTVGPFAGSYVVAMRHGGAHDNPAQGGLLKLAANGSNQQIFAFTGMDGTNPGDEPRAPLALDATGRLFGVAHLGGKYDGGVIYRLDTDGKTYLPLYEFRAASGTGEVGTRPESGLRLFNSYLYGTTSQGGPGGGGTVFRIPLTPQGTGATNAESDVTAHTATFSGSVTSNGYGGEYWFTYGLQGGPLDQESTHIAFDGFSGGPQTFSQAITGLKGHQTYSVAFHSKIGIGSDTVDATGSTITFTTPNGAPEVQDDGLIITDLDADFTGLLLANDVDSDGDNLTITAVTQPTQGTVTIAPDGKSVVYHSGLSFTGTDSFTYTVSDNYSGGALTATGKVNVLSNIAINGSYAGLLLDDTDGGVAALREGAANLPTANQIAAGFASLALTKGKSFTARFEVSGRTVAVKGSMSPDRDTSVDKQVDRNSALKGGFHVLPYGAEGRITFNGRTLVMRAGQGFSDGAAPVPVPASDFTMRMTPTTVDDPAVSDGSPAGSGFALVRQTSKAKATLVGELPDGTPFSKGTVVSPVVQGNGIPTANTKMPYFVKVYKNKSGTFNGQIVIANATMDNATIDSDAQNPTSWTKVPALRDKRFSGGFNVDLDVFGGKYKVPKGAVPVLDLTGATSIVASFDRGGLFKPLTTTFTFTGAKASADAKDPANTAKATLSIAPRTGIATGTLKSGKQALKYRAVAVQRDNKVSGYFLGNGDAGSVEVVVNH